jgi:DNA-binding transcriptional MerR regulator
MSETRYRLPNEVANQLQISPSTLRRWSNEFSEYLSESAGRAQPDGTRGAHRRYSDEDLETLMTIKGLLIEGLTYIQVGRRLDALRMRRTMANSAGATAGEAGEAGGRSSTALAPIFDPSPVAPAVTVLADTLHTVADGQQLLLGSQQANRELMSVLLQDNFSLKEENAKLRDRMLEVERDLAEMRRMDGTRRETLEVRLQRIEEALRARGNQPPSAERQGCLAQFFGPLS